MIRQSRQRNLIPSLCDAAALGGQVQGTSRSKRRISPLLELSDSVLGIITYAVGQHHQCNQLNAGCRGFHLLLGHARQVQLVHIQNDTNCRC